MADPVLYIRGFPLGAEPGIPDGLIRDARRLLDVEACEIEALSDHLETFAGFLDRRELEEVLGSHIGDPKIRDALGRLIVNVDHRLRIADQSVEQLLQQMEAWLAHEENQKKGLLSQNEFEQLKPRLALVLRRFPGLDRQAKAERLSEATGLPLQKIEIICDLRPVFDKDRDHVEGMIPYTTLRIVCTGVDGLPVLFEATLTQGDVTQLAKASADATKKLANLRELLRQKQVAVPSVEMTKEDTDK